MLSASSQASPTPSTCSKIGTNLGGQSSQILTILTFHGTWCLRLARLPGAGCQRVMQSCRHCIRGHTGPTKRLSYPGLARYPAQRVSCWSMLFHDRETFWLAGCWHLTLLSYLFKSSSGPVFRPGRACFALVGGDPIHGRRLILQDSGLGRGSRDSSDTHPP